ncbi:MAG: TraC family protein, partial [Blastocatellia bacterium]
MVLLFLAGAAILFWAGWKTGFLQKALESRTDFLARWGLYITHESGAWTDMATRLPYRDFYKDVVETAGGWIWAAAQLRPIPTDGLSNSEWNLLYDRLNRVLTTLQDETCLQVILRADNSPDDGVAIFESLANKCPQPDLAQVIKARARHLRREAKQGRIVRHRLYAIIGRQRKPLAQRIPLRALFTSSPWIDHERDDFLSLRDDALRARQAFLAAFSSIGGWARPVGAGAVFKIAYDRLNPERAERHQAPDYRGPELRGPK